MILAAILEMVYGNNTTPVFAGNAEQMIPTIVIMEEKLNAWEEALFTPLQIDTNYGNSQRGDQPLDTLFVRLRVVTRLRFLNVRIFLHRPLLGHQLSTRLAHGLEHSSFNKQQSFSKLILDQGVKMCRDAAMETLTIIHRDPHILGAWWCAAYYSKRIFSLGFS